MTNVKEVMTQMETEARANREANRAKGWGGSSTRAVEGVVYRARTSGGNCILWTRDDKRISRKAVAEQMQEFADAQHIDDMARDEAEAEAEANPMSQHDKWLARKDYVTKVCEELGVEKDPHGNYYVEGESAKGEQFAAIMRAYDEDPKAQTVRVISTKAELKDLPPGTYTVTGEASAELSRQTADALTKEFGGVEYKTIAFDEAGKLPPVRQLPKTKKTYAQNVADYQRALFARFDIQATGKAAGVRSGRKISAKHKLNSRLIRCYVTAISGRTIKQQKVYS